MTPRKSRRALAAEDDVLADREAERASGTSPVFWNERDPRVTLYICVHRRDVSSRQQDLAAGGATGAREHLHQLALPVALDARDPQDLAVAQLERRTFQCRHRLIRVRREIFNRERNAAWLGRGFVDTQQDCP